MNSKKSKEYNVAYEKARDIKKKYNRLLTKIQKKARHGDSAAAMEILPTLTAYYTELKAIGFRETDETDKGRVGRLVPITQEWIALKLSQETELDKLQKRARHGDKDALMQFVLKQNEQFKEEE